MSTTNVATRPQASGDTIPIYDPWTEEQIGEIVDGGQQAVDEAVGRARETFRAGAWIGKTPAERAKILWKVADLIEQRAKELGDIDSRNLGMSARQAPNMMVAAAEMVRYYSGWATKIYGKSADMRSGGGISGQAADLLGYA